MTNQNGARTINPPFFSRLRWRLTLSFTLVTLAAILMAAWWSFLAVNFYLASTLGEDALAQVRAQLLPTLLPLILPALVVLIIPALIVGTAFGFLTARWLENRLDRLREATDAWSAGDFVPRIYDPSRDEIGRFGRRLNQMAFELETLLRTRQELAGLEERNQLARDLHDSVKQNLAAAVLQIGAAQALLDNDPQAAQNSLEQAEELAVQTQRELTNVILELRPAELQEKDLATALQTYLGQWGHQNPIEVAYTTDGIPRLSFNHELSLFRVAQEALANVSRHSGASRVRVNLAANHRVIVLEIEDNGRGFDPLDERIQGFGLRSMHDRLASLGGTVQVMSTAGKGAIITASLPWVRENIYKDEQVEN